MDRLEQAFQHAQWGVPWGWHVEGQVLPMPGGGYVAAATKTEGPHAPERGTVAYALGYTPTLAPYNLSDRFYHQRQVPSWGHVSNPNRDLTLVIVPSILAELRQARREIKALLNEAGCQ